MIARRLSASGASLAIHLLVLAVLIWSPFDAARPSASGSPASARTAIAVNPWERRIPKSDQPAEQAEDANDALALADADVSDVRIPGFAFDIRKIVRRAFSLFPFLTGTVELRRMLDEASSDERGMFASPSAPRQRSSGKRPLAIGDEALQVIVDGAWSRRHRWEAFRAIARLVEKHDPDTGRLPALLRAYLDQNLLQPYVDTTIRDPRLWTMLGIAADNMDFVEFITAYEAKHRSTRTSAELLFLLDELVQGNLDALVALLDTDPERDMWWTRNESRKASDLLITIRRHYTTEVKRRGLTTAAALRAHFDAVRLRVLEHVLRATAGGYRANDARFLIGSIYWRQGRKHEAVSAWRAIVVDPTDSYVGAYSELLQVLDSGADPLTPVTAARVDGVLASENRRWAEFSKTRLRQFGHAFDTF